MNKTFKQTLKFYKYSTLRQAEFSKIAKAKLELLFRAYKFNFEAKVNLIFNSAKRKEKLIIQHFILNLQIITFFLILDQNLNFKLFLFVLL